MGSTLKTAINLLCLRVFASLDPIVPRAQGCSFRSYSSSSYLLSQTLCLDKYSEVTICYLVHGDDTCYMHE